MRFDVRCNWWYFIRVMRAYRIPNNTSARPHVLLHSYTATHTHSMCRHTMTMWCVGWYSCCAHSQFGLFYQSHDWFVSRIPKMWIYASRHCATYAAAASIAITSHKIQLISLLNCYVMWLKCANRRRRPDQKFDIWNICSFLSSFLPRSLSVWTVWP